MKGFLADLYLRPSCYACPTKKLKSGSDITLGDFWGIQHIKPELDDDKGICSFIINTRKGMEWQNKLEILKYKFDFADVVKGNPSLVYSANIPENRVAFYDKLRTRGLIKLVSKYTKLPLILRLKIFIYNLLKRNQK